MKTHNNCPKISQKSKINNLETITHPKDGFKCQIPSGRSCELAGYCSKKRLKK